MHKILFMKQLFLILLVIINYNCGKKDSNPNPNPNPTQVQLPSARNMHAMAFEAKTNSILVFGGALSNNTYSNELWSWNGTVWSKLNETGPNGREDAMLVYHRVNTKTYVIGGRTNTNVFTDFWEWDGTAWRLLTNSLPFGALDHAAAAYDIKNNRILVFGGANSANNYTNDVWMWDGTTWSKVVTTGTPPSGRISSHFVVNPENNKVYIFGGFAKPNQVLSDVWELAGTVWTKVSDNMPGNTLAGSVAKSPVADEFVKFGGAVNANPTTLSGDTYTWNGSAWQQKTVSTTPTGRFLHAMAYDRQRNKTYLFGGAANGISLNDFWEWDGTTWKKLN